MDPLAPHPTRAPDRLERPAADPLVGRLFPKLATGGPWKLERMRDALAALGDPHRAFRSLHVGGTNGKGSVTASAAAVLTEAGRRAGCYTSPHLCSFRERVRVDGAPLPEARLLAYADEVRDAVERFGLTFFEAATALAFQAFAREGVEVAAVEVGLGGRLDATNVIVPEVAAVTNVAMDHAEYLGTTLREIAGEKAGIAKRGVPLVTAETDPEIVAVLGGRAREAGAPFQALEPGAVRDVRVSEGCTELRVRTRAWGELEVVTPLVGAHQAVNA
ncbi:MAG TPA: Mur ligase family protein, partial [Longimicrobiales bacterium]|nr:Mur ligase family protein [Longimicrobiales bacterium]